MKHVSFDGAEFDTAERAAEHSVREILKEHLADDADLMIEAMVDNFARISDELHRLLPLPARRRAPLTDAQQRALERLISLGGRATCGQLGESPVTMNALHKKGKVTLERSEGRDYWLPT